MGKYIMALDLGSSGIKVTLFNHRASIVGSKYKEYETIYPGPNMVLQRPTDWWKSFCEASKELIIENNIDNNDILCVAPSGQMSALIPIDENNNLLMDPCLIWADMRTYSQVEEIADKFEGQKNFYYTTGIGLPPETFTYSKILWLRQNEFDIFNKTKYFVQPKEYIGIKLTGNIATDYSDASETGMFDTKKRKWSPKILDLIGISESMLPIIKKSSDLLGYITNEASQETGLAKGTPVCVGGGDVSIAASGAGITNFGDYYAYIGSGVWVGTSSKDPILDYEKRIACICSTTTEGYTPHVISISGGLSQLWARDLINEIPFIKGKITYKDMDALAEKSLVGSSGLIFLPYLRGGGAPTQNIHTRGAFVGIEPHHTYGDLSRSILEGVAYITKQMLEFLTNHTDKKLNELFFIGGGAKSSIWRQIIADVLQVPIICTSMQQEANTWGAAKCAGVCVGIWKDFHEAQKLVPREIVVEPNVRNESVYNSFYHTFLETYEQLVPIYERLTENRKMIAKFRD